MKGRFGSIVALLLGILVLAAGLMIKFVVVPALAQFPDDPDLSVEDFWRSIR